MSKSDFTKKLENLYKEEPILNQNDKKIIEEGVASQVAGIFNSVEENPSVYKAAMDSLIRLKLDDVRLLRGLTSNLQKINDLLSRMPSLVKNPENKKAVEEKLKGMKDSNTQRIEKLQTDVETIKNETQEIARNVEDSADMIKAKEQQDAEAEKADKANSFKDWFQE